MDEIGYVQFASVANVAHRARVTLEEAEAAIICLENPDPHSSDPDHEGRRIERVPGGWMILNAQKHGEMISRILVREQTRQRVKNYRERLKLDEMTEKPRVTHKKRRVTQSNASDTGVTSSDTDTDTEVQLASSINQLDPHQPANSNIRAVASPRLKSRKTGTPATNLSIITKFAYEVIDSNGQCPPEDRKDRLKWLCAERHIAYDAGVISKALDSAEAARKASPR
jgi:hypothetical protein